MATEEKKKEKDKKQKQGSTTDVKDNDLFQQWLSELYETIQIGDEELAAIYDLLRYKGFNRVEVLRQLFTKSPDKNITMQIILAVALQGPKKASLLKLTNGRTAIDMGIPASGQKGTTNLSCARIGAATADLAAYFLKRLNVPKRLNHALPSWLQFPTAGSIILPNNLRELHRDFSKLFSPMIGGIFNEQIYETMVLNAYLDPRLNLFA